MSWQQIRSGTADEGLARLYRDNQTKIFEAVAEARREGMNESGDEPRTPRPRDDDWAEPRNILKRRT